MDRGKYLAKNTLLFTIANFGTKFISFFLVPLYTNSLTKAEYGTADLVFTICSFVVPILILNINESILRFALDKNADYNKIMSVGIATLLYSCVIGIILAVFAKIYEPTSEVSIYVYLYAITLGMSFIFVSYLRGCELILQFAIGTILQTLFIAIFNILFLLVFKMGVKGYLLAYILANLATSLYSFIAGDIKAVIHHFIIDKALWIDMIKYSIVLIPNAFMWWIMNSLDRIMLTSMVGIGIVGLYAVSNKLPSLVSVATSIFNQAYAYSAIKEDESEDREKYNNKIYDYFVAFITLITIIIMIIIKPFMSIYVAKEYYSAWEYAPPLIVGTSFLSFATLLAMPYLVNKDSKGFLYSSFLGAAVNTVLNLILIPYIGAMGAALATCIAYITVLIYRHFNTQKYIRIKTFSAKHSVSYIIIALSGTMVYISSLLKYIVLFAFVGIIVLIYHDCWKDLIERILKRLCKNR